MLEVDLLDETGTVAQEETDFIQKVLLHAAEAEETGAAEVSVTLVTNEMIRTINREYRDKDAATDVISFALEEQGEDEVMILGGAEVRHLGDIIISTERAKEQAADYGHSYERELGFLAVHGFLHLLGYDHLTEQDEKKMFGRQEEILASLGLQRDGHGQG
ncbi:rRNA maturation RNase YbeY [Planococcus lenghuensis]|uniref:Endoribonuclease YbeY n=1 Tax=Planococcus lenghuensis TaxID=2213202 RepID=A0A1Q2KXN2_9BACL|nr:rRNA maturation RNase YbeY [Planococcus lenghuensis]AQQ52968.1 rRNA maturation RNase YbeY [Planococcus lenghuensis]